MASSTNWSAWSRRATRWSPSAGWRRSSASRTARRETGETGAAQTATPAPESVQLPRTRDAQQAELAAVALVREGVRSLLTWTSSSITNVPAWTSMRNAPGPKTFEASTMPLDSHAPSRPRFAFASTSSRALVGRLASTFAATRFVPPARSCCQSRAVVALASVGVNCWLEPGSSVSGGSARSTRCCRAGDLVRRLHRRVVALDQDREARHLGRVARVEHELPDTPVRRRERVHARALAPRPLSTT